MHQHNHTSQNSDAQFVRRHLLLLGTAIIALVILYLATRTVSVVGGVAVLLIAAHILALLVIVYGGRSLLSMFIRKVHGVPQEPQAHTHDDNTHGHYHNADDLQTEGRTISWAWFYDIFVKAFFAGKIQAMMRSTVKLAAIQSGETVLDIGCGTGTLALLAKKTTPSAIIYGTDASPEMIERAQQKAQETHTDVLFRRGLAEKMDFPDNTFDVVMNSLMMHHLTPALRQAALAEAYRVLKPNGRLLIVDFEPPKAGLYKSFLTLILGDMTRIDNTTLPPLVKQAGFTQVDIAPTDVDIATYIAGVKPQS